jgi:hypothetical protein
LGSRIGIELIPKARALPSTALDEHLMPIGHQFLNPGGGQTNPILMGFDFTNAANFHFGILQ